MPASPSCYVTLGLVGHFPLLELDLPSILYLGPELTCIWASFISYTYSNLYIYIYILKSTVVNIGQREAS